MALQYHKNPYFGRKEQKEDSTIDDVSNQLKSAGHFDKIRSECIGIAQDSPEFTELQRQVKNFASEFLDRHKWRPDLNKSALRDQLRVELMRSSFLQNGVQRISESVVQRDNIQTKLRFHVAKLLSEYVEFSGEKAENSKVEESNFGNSSYYGNVASEDQPSYPPMQQQYYPGSPFDIAPYGTSVGGASSSTAPFVPPVSLVAPTEYPYPIIMPYYYVPSGDNASFYGARGAKNYYYNQHPKNYGHYGSYDRPNSSFQNRRPQNYDSRYNRIGGRFDRPYRRRGHFNYSKYDD